MRIPNLKRLLAIPLLLALAPAGALGAEESDWNNAQVAWRSFDEGLAEARGRNVPICLVFYTNWCPHCKTYSRVFHDAQVVDRAKSFVMIRVERDGNKELSSRFAPDGEYIPRTYFLSFAGELDVDLKAPRESYKYFYDEHAPASLLAGMASALEKLAPAPQAAPRP